MRLNGIGRIFGVAAGTILVISIFVIGSARLSPTQASEASDRLVARGLLELNAGRYVNASKYFNGAVQIDKEDPRALFYLGVVLNRLGQHGAALAAFQRMWTLKVTHRQLGLEAGWAAIAQGRSGLAISLLEPYVRDNPDVAKAHEFLGRAYIGDGRLDDAERELKKAIALDPSLKPTSLYYIGNIAALRKDAGGVGAALSNMMEDAPDSLASTVLRETLRRAAEGAPDRNRSPWFVSFSLSGGHNSNVIGLPDGSILPSDISQKDSKFIRTQFNAGYRWQINDATSLTGGYGLTHTHYNELGAFDSTTHNLYLDLRYRIDQRIGTGFRLSRSLSLTDSETSVQSVTGSPSVTYRWNRTDATSLRYSRTSRHYANDPARRVLDRDATVNALTLSHNMLIDNEILPLGVNTQFGVSRTYNNAAGDDYDYQGTSYFITLARKFPWDLFGTMSFSHEIDRYDNPNSLAGSGFNFVRGDKINRLNFYLEKPVEFFDVKGVSAFVNWEYLDNRSNIAFFDYEQTSFNIGFTARF